MNQSELLAKLGLGDKPQSQRVQVDYDYHPATGVVVSTTPVSDTALILDKWDLARGEELSKKLREVRGEEAMADLPDETASLADFHAAAFTGEPILAEKSAQERRWEFLKTVMETPEYKTLHESTQYNELASEMAATQFADEFVGLTKGDEKRKEKMEKTTSSKAKEKLERQGEMAVVRAAGKALKSAQQDVDDLEDMESSLGAGLGQGGQGKLNTEAVAKRFQKVRNNHRLRNIINKAGRYRRFAQGRQRQKTSHGYEDMIGIKLDDSVDHLLDEELACLLDDDLELDTLRRIAERETLAHEYKGSEKVGLGPIIVCVDESGSMGGDPIEQAKAFALSMYWIAQHQKRFCCLIGYSGGTEGTVLVIPPGKKKEEELLEWLGHFFSGGTTMDVPLSELPNKYWTMIGAPKGKTDLILITDAIVHIPTPIRDAFLAWKKKEKVRTITLLIGGCGEAGDLGAVSDEVFNVSKIGLESEGVQRCLSI